MSKRREYTRKGVDQVIKDLVGWAQVTEQQHYPPHFVKKHPWTSRYLGFFSEALQFKKLVHDSDLLICEDVNENIDRYRSERGLPRNVRIRVSVKEIRHRNDVRTFVFTFQEVGPNKFICLNS